MKTRKNTKRIVTMIVVLCLAFTALTAGAFADNAAAVKSAPTKSCYMYSDDSTVMIIIDNQSDKYIRELYLATPEDTSWGIDLLEDDVIGPNSQYMPGYAVNYTYGTSYQLRFRTCDGDVVTTNAFTFDNISDSNCVTISIYEICGDYYVYVD